MNIGKNGSSTPAKGTSRGLGALLLGPLLRRLGGARSARPRLELLERISLAPKQSLALVEAEGRRFLVATSAEGGQAFLALDSPRPAQQRSPRVSW